MNGSFNMSIQQPVVAVNNIHKPIDYGDVLNPDSIPVSGDSSNAIMRRDDGLYASGSPFIPSAFWDIGHTDEPNNANGIDEGDYWRYDFSKGNGGDIPGLQFDNGYLVFPPGQFVILMFGLLNTSASGQFRASFFDRSWGYPGPYQFAVQTYLQLPVQDNGRQLYGFTLCGKSEGGFGTCGLGYDKTSDEGAHVNGTLTILKIQ